MTDPARTGPGRPPRRRFLRIGTSVAAASVLALAGCAAPSIDDYASQTPVLDLRSCLFDDDIQRAAVESDPSPLLRAFTHSTGNTFSALGEAQLDLLRGVIHADAVVHPPAIESGALFSAAAIDGDVMKVMDRQQERLAKSIGSGHRVIRGVAARGKPLVLVHSARLLARVMPTTRGLVTCFTR